MIAELLKRNPSAIRRRARMLKIKLARSPPGPYSSGVGRLAELCGM
jgi:hypothetical protein